MRFPTMFLGPLLAYRYSQLLAHDAQRQSQANGDYTCLSSYDRDADAYRYIVHQIMLVQSHGSARMFGARSSEPAKAI